MFLSASWVRGSYFADGALVVFADDSHFVDAAVADGLVVALADPDEVTLLGAEYTLNSHS